MVASVCDHTILRLPERLLDRIVYVSRDFAGTGPVLRELSTLRIRLRHDFACPPARR